MRGGRGNGNRQVPVRQIRCVILDTLKQSGENGVDRDSLITAVGDRFCGEPDVEGRASHVIDELWQNEEIEREGDVYYLPEYAPETVYEEEYY